MECVWIMEEINNKKLRRNVPLRNLNYYKSKKKKHSLKEISYNCILQITMLLMNSNELSTSHIRGNFKLTLRQMGRIQSSNRDVVVTVGFECNRWIHCRNQTNRIGNYKKNAKRDESFELCSNYAEKENGRLFTDFYQIPTHRQCRFSELFPMLSQNGWHRHNDCKISHVHNNEQLFRFRFGQLNKLNLIFHWVINIWLVRRWEYYC